MTSLVAVRAALKVADTDEAGRIAALIDEAKLAPYKSKESVKQRLGAIRVESPTLGKKQAPKALRKRQSNSDLQQMCLRELSEMREHLGDRYTFFSQPDNNEAPRKMSLEDAGMQTINSLTDSSLDATATLVKISSKTLESLCTEDWEAPDNLLPSPITRCMILPSNTLIPLHHSNQGTTVTTLLSGSIVWVIWLPTDGNHRTLQTAYENLAQGNGSELDLATDLDGGIIFVQNVGDGLHIPPFSPMMALSTSTSVLATSSEVTVENFISMLQKLALLKAWFQTELNGDLKQAEFGVELLRTFSLLLNGVDDQHVEEDDDEDSEPTGLNHLQLPRVEDGLLAELLNIWDDIKNNLSAMLGSADHKTMENIWGHFLISMPGQNCAICRKRVKNKQKLMKKHFIDMHWVTCQEKKRKASEEALDDDAGASKRTRRARTAEAGDRGGDISE
jgi:hypothetical protein